MSETPHVVSLFKRFLGKLRPMAGKRFLWIIPVVLVGGIVVITRVSGKEVEGVNVLETAYIEYGDVKKEILATGVVRPEEGAVVKLGTRFTGVISELYVKLGDAVTKGQLIAELDGREQEFICQQNRATIQKLKTQLMQQKMKYPLQIKEAAASLHEAEVEKKYAAQTYARNKKLAQSGHVAEEKLDDTIRTLRVAEQTVVARRSTKERLESEFQYEIPSLEDAVLEAEAALKQCTTRLSYAHLVSPMSGVVSEITARQGETVVAGLQVANLITIIDTERLELQILIDENDIGSVKQGAAVKYTVESYPEKEFSGQVALIHPGPELRDNIVYYRALVRVSPEDAHLLRPEMTARCYVSVVEKKHVLCVPNAAFKWVGDKHVVFVCEGDGVYPVQVTTGLDGLFVTEVVAGLEEGQQIATHLELPDVLPADWDAVL
ncbi:efflux RND transporter periplasmic adaptor subunit [Pseudodesulfovibrio piezophilus]|uniref:Secretion protein HlyD n=1 Tax=Pseudodesulfovibrio piezophilus (strain DSM 21447 / JCM 15486 / C1TLV30) TaxID=1322246 RepID=M1WJT9_PSEP2|nr:efflux RND transporter periplasmic adaptor subunit [Pseudodesulfovibrio piezophilus]CCH48476.1 Secretion protein HlyD [Pseudodesulfovibrio piezophilus C1TLV30]